MTKKKYSLKNKSLLQTTLKRKDFQLPSNCNNIFGYRAAIVFKKHNIFCNFSDMHENKTLISCSSWSGISLPSSPDSPNANADSNENDNNTDDNDNDNESGNDVFKIKTTKKTMRYGYPSFLRKFYLKVKTSYYKLPLQKYNFRKGILAKIISSSRFRKKVVRFTRKVFRKVPLLLNLPAKKIYNGCRPPKKIRKKRRGSRMRQRILK